MHITFNQLKVFREVAQQQSITRAAEALHMTQPAVSIQIKQLEQQVGLPLIEVIGKKLHLTHAGEVVLASAHNIKDEIQFLRDTVIEMKGGVQGNLKIAAVTTAQHFLPHLLGKFHREYPKIELSLKIRNRAEVIERLYQNLDDLVVLSQLPEDNNIIAEKILVDQLVIVSPKSFALSVTSLHKLKALPWLIREKGSGTRMAMERYFNEHHFEPTIAMELGSSEAIIEAVAAGIGLAILAKSTLPVDIEYKDIHLVNIKESLPELDWFAVYLKDKKILPAAKNFLRVSLR